MDHPAPLHPIRGRGTRSDPPNRFEQITLEPDLDQLDAEQAAGEERPDPRTRYYRDETRSVLTFNRSPDIPFAASLNPYRGCEHGCVYCYARPGHEYLGLSAGLDFETKIFVKQAAPELLRESLASPRWQPQVIAISGVTDPYQPIERRLRITRRCLEVLAEFRNPVGLITKSRLVARDCDVLGELARHDCAAVTVSITTLDPDLARALEPRAAQPRSRLAAIEALAAAGVPVGVNAAPIIPGLNDHEIPAILRAAADAGARRANYTLVRLPYAVKDLFTTWLGDHAPERRDKVLNRIREMRGGRLNDPRFGSRMRGEGVFADQIDALFTRSRARAGLEHDFALSTSHFRNGRAAQLDLF
jgi:DNA repair photolyase